MNRDPWASYWSQENRGSPGCLPQGESEIGARLAQYWKVFAGTLRPGAKVLDLASGDGAVLKTLASAGVRLDLCGVDSAPTLPKAKGYKLLAGVRMEILPFEAKSMDAVTSQFGIEYGDVGAIAREMRRVLKADGRVQLVVHHRASRIVAHNDRRRRALHWAREGSGIPKKARKLAETRRHLPLPTPLSFPNAVRDAGARFPDQPVAAEYLAGIHQALSVRPEESLARLAWLDQNSADEVGRIDALLAAACDQEKIEEMRALLADAGFEVESTEPLNERDGVPFAWSLAVRQG